MLSAADQTAIITAMPSSITAYVGEITSAGIIQQGAITVDYRFESEPIMYNDGSVEAGKPYCVASSADVESYAIEHGRILTIGTTPWYVIGKKQRQDGMYRIQLSKDS